MMALTKDIDLQEILVHLSRLALQEKSNDIKLYLQRVSRRLRSHEPQLAEKLAKLTRTTGQSGVFRNAPGTTPPVDLDTRLELIQREAPVILAHEPIWDAETYRSFRQFVAQRQQQADLASHGLAPARSLLLTGPPGVGKTLGGRWIARELGLPLFILDLSAVMNSFLGRTGNNLRAVLDYAKNEACVLFLDEFDSIAKRRDDATEIGELKRLVTVLLQEIDKWPEEGVLIAATNHEELLDPAVWRRFDTVATLRIPQGSELRATIKLFLATHSDTVGAEWIEILCALLNGQSHSNIENELLALRRSAIIEKNSLLEAFEEHLQSWLQTADKRQRKMVGIRLLNAGVTQRRASKLVGISRDTLRKAIGNENTTKGVYDG